MAPRTKMISGLLHGPKEEIVVYSRSVKKIQEQLKKKLENPAFIVEIKKFRSQYKIMKDLKSFSAPKGYERDLIRLMQKFDMHHGWRVWLERHITYSSFPEDLSDPEGIEFITKSHNDKTKDYYLKIYPSTIVQDLEKVFRKIKSREPAFKSHSKKWLYFDRDKKIHKLHGEGKNDMEIHSILSKEGNSPSLGSIRTIVSRYKKKMQLR